LNQFSHIGVISQSSTVIYSTMSRQAPQLSVFHCRRRRRRPPPKKSNRDMHPPALYF
jgi:hypothetical protein